MKYLFAFLAIFFAVNYANAQNSNPWPTSGNVNIGGGNYLIMTDPNLNTTSGITWFTPSPLHYGINRTPGVWAAPNYQQLSISWDAGVIVNPGTNESSKSYLEVTGGGIRVTNGALGIGTTAPQISLDVNGNLLAGGTNLDGVNLGYLSNSGRMLVGWNRTAGAGETDFISNQGGGGTGGFAYYNYSNSGSQSLLMYLRGNGQLTIGDCNPYSYKLAVGGSMITESITVKTLANWPDYVFKPTYKLPSLSEVKAYIDQNQHLPEMPSAAEVEKNGVNLGEMVKLQTKKIEELTLYLIEKDKEVIEQRNKIAKLTQLNEKIFQRLEVLENKDEH